MTDSESTVILTHNNCTFHVRTKYIAQYFDLIEERTLYCDRHHLGLKDYREYIYIFHCDDAPAILTPFFEQWILHGRRHRDGGPSYISSTQTDWFRYGLLHRADGPARIVNGVDQWWLNGRRHRVDGPAITYLDGTQWWYLDGRHHRVGGPAIENFSHTINEWYYHGLLHRTNGPAMEDNGYYSKWYYQDKLHRHNGPAVDSRRSVMNGGITVYDVEMMLNSRTNIIVIVYNCWMSTCQYIVRQ
jgi:hypothetical protein